MDDAIIAAVRAHAAREAPRECCGLVLIHKGRLRYRPCRNVTTEAEQFEIHPADWAAAEDGADRIVAVAHSHVFRAPEPSPADRVQCEASGLPWLIVNHPLGTVAEIAPAGYRLPLEGRQFVHGIVDCYSLIRDYYRDTLAISLPDFPRPADWWLKGGNLYEEQFAEAGFAPVQNSAVREHDVVLMTIRIPPDRPQVANHGAVYLGGNVVLQHLQGRLSSRDIYGGWYQRATTLCLRHGSLL